MIKNFILSFLVTKIILSHKSNKFFQSKECVKYAAIKN